MIANYWPHVLAMLVGGALTVQVGMNATLARSLGSPLWASAISFAIGLVALVGFAIVAGSRVATGTLGQMPALAAPWSPHLLLSRRLWKIWGLVGAPDFTVGHG